MASEKERLHWMPVHVNDLTSDEQVLVMTTQDFGAYFKLLCAAWKSDPPSIPDDDVILARLTGLTPREWAKAKERVLAPWKSSGDGRLYQKRQRVVHADVIAKIEQKREAGKRGGKAKAAKSSEHKPANNPSESVAPLEQRHTFANSEQGSETLAGAYQPLTINQSVSNETLPPNPQSGELGGEAEPENKPRRQRQSASPHPGTSGIEIAGQKVLFEDDEMRWIAEFVRRWNLLSGVAKHSGSALSTFNLRLLKSRLAESDWSWELAFKRFPLWLPSGIWQITLGTFLEPGTVSKILEGKYGQRTEQAGLFGGGKPSSVTRVRGASASDAEFDAVFGKPQASGP